MRICQVMLARGFGGAERYFVDLSVELARRGHEVLAVCHPAGMARDRLTPVPGLEIAPLRTWGPWDPLAPRRLRKLIAAYGPEAVQSHLARGTRVAARAMTGMALPLLAKTHNYVDLKYYRGVTLFLPTTRDQAAYLAQSGVARERVRVIPNFSPLPVAEVPADRARAVLAMGRFVAKKGFAELLSAWARLKARGVSLPPLRLAGDGPLRADLERRARELGLADLVQFVGWQKDAARFLDSGTLFVLPSLEEPFGIAVLEAMARGVPIIATTTAGPREILDDDTALLVPPGDIDALADALGVVLAEPGDARARAARARARFKALYAADVVVPQLLAAYAAARDLRQQPGVP